MKMSNIATKCEVLIKQYLCSILDISAVSANTTIQIQIFPLHLRHARLSSKINVVCRIWTKNVFQIDIDLGPGCSKPD